MVTEGQPQTKKGRLKNTVIIFLVSLVVVICVAHLVFNITKPTLPVFEFPPIKLHD
jgi:hypothetical protein